MRIRLGSLAVGAAVLALAATGKGDDLKGQDRMLCTAVEATVCIQGGDCTIESPFNLNIPQFIDVNLKDRTFSTTKASGENRATPIRSMTRENGLIILQGYEDGRAFSFVIGEDDGIASIAVARDAVTVSVFGACTPMPAAGK